jgi:uncharacterized damage-inducible protein DinB
MSVADMYEGWSRIQKRLVSRLPLLSERDLGLRASADGWPVWAIVSHLAGARVYWLCSVCGEPGLETTPFRDPANEGWEDTLDIPRNRNELLEALESSWRIVESSLERWTPGMLAEAFKRVRDGAVERHTRSSVLTRLVMHDAFHAGEVSQLLGQNALPSLDPWAISVDTGEAEQ